MKVGRSGQSGDKAGPAGKPGKGGRDDWNNHWSDFSEATSLNPAQEYRRRLILGRARKLAWPGARVLDIGCGVGELAGDLFQALPESSVRGLDLSATGVKIASKRFPKVEFLRWNLLSPRPLPKGWRLWADLAVCSEVLEHLDDPIRFLKNSAMLLRPGGTLLVTVPGGPRSAFDRFLGHRRHFRSGDLKELLERAGLNVARVERAGFPFFNIYKLLLVLRGKRLSRDVSTGTGQRLSSLARLLMALFRAFFRANLEQSPWGWQLLAVARKHGARGSYAD